MQLFTFLSHKRWATSLLEINWSNFLLSWVIFYFWEWTVSDDWWCGGGVSVGPGGGGRLFYRRGGIWLGNWVLDFKAPYFGPLSTDPTELSNTLKQFVGACGPRLMRFIMLVSFSGTLLVVSILDKVYNCHLGPLLQSWRV